MNQNQIQIQSNQNSTKKTTIHQTKLRTKQKKAEFEGEKDE